jgi:hypothetical protein
MEQAMTKNKTIAAAFAALTLATAPIAKTRPASTRPGGSFFVAFRDGEPAFWRQIAGLL